MFDSLDSSASSRRITVVTFLLLGFLASPVLVFFSAPWGSVAALLGAVLSMLCVVMVWFNRTRPASVRHR